MGKKGLFGDKSRESIYQILMQFHSHEKEREYFLKSLSIEIFRIAGTKEDFAVHLKEFLDANEAEIIPLVALANKKAFSDYVIRYAKDQKIITDSKKGMVRSSVTLGKDLSGALSSRLSKDLLVRREIMTPILTKAFTGVSHSMSSPFSPASAATKIGESDLSLAKSKVSAYEAFKKEFLTNLERYILVNIPPRRNFGHGHTFEIRNLSDFLNAVRLTNRSDARLMRNYKDAQSTDDITTFNYDIQFPRLGVIHKSDGKRLEYSKEKDRFSKTELILGGDASYPAIAAKINEFKKSHGFLDADIANFIRYSCGFNILKDQASSIEKINNFLHSPEIKGDVRRPFLKAIAELSALFFYAETIRNPASFVMHQMMLDQIISGKRSWGYFLAGDGVPQKMPMAPVGAVPEARAAHDLFKDFTPWHYQYHGDKVTSADRLLLAENALFQEWLENKNITPIFAEEALLMACHQWYGMDMAMVVYGEVKVGEALRNPIKDVLNKWVEKRKKTPPQNFTPDDYKLLQNLVMQYDCELTKEERANVSDAILDVVKLDDKNEEEGKFLVCLAQKGLFDFDYTRDDDKDESLLLWVAGKCNRDLFNIMFKKCSDKTLNKTGKSQNDNVLIWAAEDSWFEECLYLAKRMSVETLNEKFFEEDDKSNNKTALTFILESKMTDDQKKELFTTLIKRGVEICDKTKESKFYLDNKDDFMSMKSVAKSLEEAAEEIGSPSPSPHARSSSQASSRRSSRSRSGSSSSSDED